MRMYRYVIHNVIRHWYLNHLRPTFQNLRKCAICILGQTARSFVSSWQWNRFWSRFLPLTEVNPLLWFQLGQIFAKKARLSYGIIFCGTFLSSYSPEFSTIIQPACLQSYRVLNARRFQNILCRTRDVLTLYCLWNFIKISSWYLQNKKDYCYPAD